MTILHQLALAAATLALMGASAVAGFGPGIFVLAYIGGDTISRYDPGHGVRQGDGPRRLGTYGDGIRGESGQ